MLNPARRDQNFGVLQGNTPEVTESMLLQSIATLQSEMARQSRVFETIRDTITMDIQRIIEQTLRGVVSSLQDMVQVNHVNTELPLAVEPLIDQATSIFTYPKIQTINELWDVWNGQGLSARLTPLKELNASQIRSMGRDQYCKRAQICKSIEEMNGSLAEKLAAFKLKHDWLYNLRDNPKTNLKQEKLCAFLRSIRPPKRKAEEQVIDSNYESLLHEPRGELEVTSTRQPSTTTTPELDIEPSTQRSTRTRNTGTVARRPPRTRNRPTSNHDVSNMACSPSPVTPAARSIVRAATSQYVFEGPEQYQAFRAAIEPLRRSRRRP